MLGGWNFETLFAGSAFIAVIAACWNWVKQLIRQCTGVWIERVEVQGPGARLLLDHIMTEFGRSPFDGWSVGSGHKYVRPWQRVAVVYQELPPMRGGIYWRHWRPLWMSFQNNHVGNQPMGNGRLSLSFVRGLFSARELLASVNGSQADKKGEDRTHVLRRFGQLGASRDDTRARHGYAQSGEAPQPADNDVFALASYPGLANKYLHWTHDEIGIEKGIGGEFGNLCLPVAGESVLAESRRWLNSRQWHLDKGIPWTLGWLLYGPPGTGKSSLAGLLSVKLNLPLNVFDLATFSNRDFSHEWQDMLASHTPCICLVEDIDAVFNGRRNVNAESMPGALSFDAFLNALSGVEAANGVLLVITTNKPATLDAALLRAGRIDHQVELGPLDKDCRTRLASRILSEWPDEIAPAIAAGDGETGAAFQRRCADIALSKFRAGSLVQGAAPLTLHSFPAEETSDYEHESNWPRHPYPRPFAGGGNYAASGGNEGGGNGGPPGRPG